MNRRMKMTKEHLKKYIHSEERFICVSKIFFQLLNILFWEI